MHIQFQSISTIRLLALLAGILLLGLATPAEAKITSFTNYPSGGYTMGQTITLSGTYAYDGSATALYPTQAVSYKLDGADVICWMNPNYPGLGISGTWSCSLPTLGPGTHSIQVFDVHNAPWSGYTWPLYTFYGVTTFTVYAPGTGPVPTVSTYSASNITTSGATLNGYADLNGLSSGTGWFRYSTSAASLNCAADTGGTRTSDYTFVDPFAGFGAELGITFPPVTTYSYNTALSGLSLGTTYYYCAIAATVNGVGSGAIQSFTPTQPAPTVQTMGYTATSPSTATLRGQVNPQGLSAEGWYRYSTVNPGPFCNDTFGTRVPTSGGTALGSGTTNTPLTIDISGLTLGTRYYYCALASNSVGTGKGNVLSFTMAVSNLLSENLVLSSGALITGQNVRFRASTKNTGTVSTGSNFSNNFTYRWGTSGTWTSLSTHTMNTLSPGGTRTDTSLQFTLGNSGTLQVQYCSDSASQIGESDENDNCTVQTFTVVSNVVVPPFIPPAPELSVIPRITAQGSSATLSWDTKNGNESLCTLTGGGLTSNPLTATTKATGTLDVAVNARTTYTLTCPQGSDSVTVEITSRNFET